MDLQLVVFDMAGTTVDEQNLVYKTVHRAVEAAGYHLSFGEVLLHGAGKEKLQAIKDVIAHAEKKEVDEEVAKSIHQHFKGMLERAYETAPVSPQVGAETIFTSLKEMGVKVALNTGYTEQTAQQLLKRLGWEIGKTVDEFGNG